MKPVNLLIFSSGLVISISHPIFIKRFVLNDLILISSVFLLTVTELLLLFTSHSSYI